MLFIKKRKLFLMLPVLLFAAVACETVVEVPIPHHTPKLAVRCTITTEQLDSIQYMYYPENHAFIGRSSSILTSQTPPPVASATMVITDAAGVVVETFRPGMIGNPGGQDHGYYRPVSNFKPQPGQAYKLTVTAPGFETVTGELTLPMPLQGIQLKYAPTESNPFYSTGQVTFTIQDNGAEENFYFVKIIPLDSLRQRMNDVQVYEDFEKGGIGNDIQGIYLSDNYSDIRPFDDKTFSGRTLSSTHTISYYNHYYGPGGNPPRVKYLRALVGSITKGTYQFYKSVDNYYNTNENPFTEPTRIQGNLQNGYGFFGGHATSYVDIEVPQ